MTVLFKYISAGRGEMQVFISQDRLSYAAEINKPLNLSGWT